MKSLKSRIPSAKEEVRRRLQKALKSCDVCAATLTGSSKGRFEWCDSVVVKALQEGSWLLLDGANLCSAAVLDRLNSVLEPEGRMLLSERGAINGSVPLIQAHPNFRLFLTMKPKYGELSRAMRNRGIEIYVPVMQHARDSLAVLKHLGVSRTDSAAFLDYFR